MTTSKKEFQEFIKSLIDKDPDNKKLIAHHFGISFPTVERWAAGKSSPRRIIRDVVLKALKEKFQTG